MSPKEIGDAIENVDEKLLPKHVIVELMKFVPTEDEIALLQPFGEDPSKLASAERFYFEISQIDRYGEKLAALQFLRTFEERMEDIRQSVDALAQGTKEVKQSKKMKELLQLILAIGNYMNSGQRGGAYGFKLGSLLKLGDTKSTITNRKHTLLHYICEIVEQKFRNVDGFQAELAHSEDASKVAIPSVRSELTSIRNALKDVSSLVTSMQGDGSNRSTFLKNLKQFYDSANDRYTKMDEKFKNTEAEFLDLVDYFCEPKTTTPEEFFGIFFKFGQMYQQAKDENEFAIRKIAEDEKREKERQERHEAIQRKKNSRMIPADAASAIAKSVNSVGNGGDGQLDDLISALKTGEAFFHGFKPQQRRPRRGSKGDESSAAPKKN